MSLAWVGYFLGEDEGLAGGGGIAMFKVFFPSLNNIEREKEIEF